MSSTLDAQIHSLKVNKEFLQTAIECIPRCQELGVIEDDADITFGVKLELQNRLRKTRIELATCQIEKYALHQMKKKRQR